MSARRRKKERSAAPADRAKGETLAPSPGWRRHERAIVAALLLAGLAWRVGVWLEIRSSPYADLLTVDGAWHHERALQIAAGRYREDVFFRAPLYYYLLGMVYAVAGGTVKVAQAWQVAMSALTPLGLYLAARRAFGARAAMATLALAAFYAMFAYFAVGELVTVTLTLLLNSFGLWRLLVAIDSGRERDWLGAGLLFGLSAITRPDVLAFVALLPFWILWRHRKAGLDRRASIRAVAFLAAGVALPLLPVTAHNLFRGGDRVLVASQGGINFFIGNNPGADGVSPVVPEIEAHHGDFEEHVPLARQALGRPEAKPSEISAYWAGRGRAFIFAEPAAWLRLELRKAYLYWNAHEIGNNRVIRFVTDRSVLATHLSLKFWLVAPLAAVGLWLAAQQGRDVWPFVSYVAAYFGVTILYFVNARFRMPIVPVLLLLAGHAIVSLPALIRERPMRRAVLASLVFVTVALAIWPYAPLARGEINGHFQDALMFAKAGDRDNALREMLLARALKPESVATHLALGRMYLERFGDLPHSVESFEEAIRLAPGDPVPIHDLGVAYLGAGRYADAEAQFRRVLQMAPTHVKALDNLAYALEKQGRNDEARPVYRRLLEIAPDFPGARAKLEQTPP